MAPTERGRAAAPVLALVVNAFVWGVSWWPLRELQSHGLHPLWATAGVYLAVLAVLALVQPKAWRGLAGHPEILLLMAAAGLTNVGFNWAVTVGDVVRVVLLFYLMPAWSVLLAWPLLGERPTPAALLRLALALAGVLVILKTPGTPWPLPESLADGLALLGGFSFALTNILLRRLHRTPPATRVRRHVPAAARCGHGGRRAGRWGRAWCRRRWRCRRARWSSPACWGWPSCWATRRCSTGRPALAAQTTALVMLSEVLFASVSSVLAGAAQMSERTWVGGALVVAAAAWSAWAAPGQDRADRRTIGGMTTVYDFQATAIDGKTVALEQYRGQPLLIVNTASACGFTPQFGGLQQLHEQYGPRGLVVLGFPCNQFGAQDPGSNDEIAQLLPAQLRRRASR